MCADRAYPCFLYLRNGQNHGMIFLAQILPAGSLMVQETGKGAWRPAAVALDGCRFFCLRGYAAQSRKARCKKQPER